MKAEGQPRIERVDVAGHLAHEPGRVLVCGDHPARLSVGDDDRGRKLVDDGLEPGQGLVLFPSHRLELFRSLPDTAVEPDVGRDDVVLRALALRHVPDQPAHRPHAPAEVPHPGDRHSRGEGRLVAAYQLELPVADDLQHLHAAQHGPERRALGVGDQALHRGVPEHSGRISEELLTCPVGLEDDTLRVGHHVGALRGQQSR